jgi:hypothetical protein
MEVQLCEQLSINFTDFTRAGCPPVSEVVSKEIFNPVYNAMRMKIFQGL